MLPFYYFIVTGCELGNPRSTSDNQQHGFTNLVAQATANCTAAPNIFNIFISDLFLTSEMRIISHAPY
jgi:hypothetical protein